MAFSMNFTQELRGGDAFICTECGEGFRLYPKLVEHMAIHGLTGVFSSDGISNGSSVNPSIEVALHENGTLTVVDRSVLSNFTFLFGKPQPKRFCPPPSQETIVPSKMPEKEPALYKCDRCGQLFKTSKSLHLHQQYRALEQGFKCTLCCKVLNDRESLQNHLQNHAHERFYSCGHCGKRFLRQDSLLSHQKQWHGSASSRILSRSQEDQENSMDRSYPCKSCGLRFFWLSDLQSHLNSHSRVNKSPNEVMQDQALGEENRKIDDNSVISQFNEPCCGLCGQNFLNTSDLREHHKVEHPDEIEVKDSSVLPAKAKQQYHGVMRHMVAKQHKQLLRVNIKGKPKRINRATYTGKLFSCKHCHRVFVHSSSLSRHMRYHKGTLHACVYCGRHFPQRCDVTRHVAMYHASELQSKSQEESTTEHETGNGEQEPMKESTQTTSDGEQEDLEEENQPSSKSEDLFGSRFKKTFKPKMKYKCKECCRVFGLLSVFQRHMVHHKRNPYRLLLSCPLCPSRFSFTSALNRHLECHHKRDPGTDVTKPPETNDINSQVQQEDSPTEYLDSNANIDMSSEILNESSECSQI